MALVCKDLAQATPLAAILLEQATLRVQATALLQAILLRPQPRSIAQPVQRRNLTAHVWKAVLPLHMLAEQLQSILVMQHQAIATAVTLQMAAIAQTAICQSASKPSFHIFKTARLCRGGFFLLNFPVINAI
jgi:hypothetical protein